MKVGWQRAVVGCLWAILNQETGWIRGILETEG